MLRRIRIEGFRSCKDVLLDSLGSITALVGRNGSGKTNILRAIDWLARSATSTDIMRPRFLRQISLLPARVTADIECGESRYRYSFGIGLGGPGAKGRGTRGRPFLLRETLALLNAKEQEETILDRQDEAVTLSGRQEPIRIGSLAPCLPALAALLPAGENSLRHIRCLLDFLRATRYYSMDEPSEVTGTDAVNLIRDDQYQQWVSRYRSTGEAGDSVLMRLLYAYYEQKPKFEELLALLGPNGLGLLLDVGVGTLNDRHGDAEKDASGEERKFHLVRFRPGKQLGSGQHPLDYDDLSLGTRRVIRLLVALIVDGSVLMLIEHPEDGIHRGLVKKLIHLLRVNTNPQQVILSSHSASVLNAMDAKALRLVSVQRGVTKVRALKQDEVAAATRFIDEEGTLDEFVESVEG